MVIQWYTKKEQGSRVNIWFSFNGVGQIVGGCIAYGIAVGTAKNGSSIAPWKIIFLVTGLLTVALGFVFLWIVPDNQLNARWLKKEDRILAVARVRINQQGIGNKHFKLYQVKEALLDPMSWAFFFYALIADIPNGGITNFFSQLVRHGHRFTGAFSNKVPTLQIKSFGFTEQQSLILGVPGGAVEVIALLLNGYMGHITNQRILCSLGGLVSAMVGMILIVALPQSDNTGRLIGYYMTQASPTAFVALLAMISSNVAGYTKKTTVAAMYLIGYCVGNIIGEHKRQTFSILASTLTKSAKARKPSVPKMPRATSPPKLPSSSAWACPSASCALSGGGTARRITGNQNSNPVLTTCDWKIRSEFLVFDRLWVWDAR